MSFLEKAMDDLYQSVHAYVSKAFNTLSERMSAVEKRVSEIPSGPKGERGDKGDPGINGKDGDPGKDADISKVNNLVSAEISKSYSEMADAFVAGLND